MALVRQLSLAGNEGKCCSHSHFRWSKLVAAFPVCCRICSHQCRKWGCQCPPSFLLSFWILLWHGLGEWKWLVMHWATGCYTEGFSVTYSSIAPLLYLDDLEQLHEMKVMISCLFWCLCSEMLQMLTLSWTKSVRNSAQTMTVLKIGFARRRRRMLNPKWRTIVLCKGKKCRHMWFCSSWYAIVNCQEGFVS